MRRALILAATGLALAVGGPGGATTDEASAHDRRFPGRGFCAGNAGWYNHCTHTHWFLHHHGRAHWWSHYYRNCVYRRDARTRRWELQRCNPWTVREHFRA